MRTVGPILQTAIEARSGANYGVLIGIQLSSPLYVCSYDGDVTWKGNTYLGNQGVIASVSPSSDGEATARILKEDLDGSFVALLRTEPGGWINHEVVIAFAGSGPGTYVDDQAKRIFKGVTGAYNTDNVNVTWNCGELGATDQSSPRILTDEICRHIPPVGFVYTWNGQKYIVQRGP